MTQDVERFSTFVGTKVRKKSGKPFKSGLNKNTVQGVIINPHSGKIAFSFIEDDSLVNCEIVLPA